MERDAARAEPDKERSNKETSHELEEARQGAEDTLVQADPQEGDSEGPGSVAWREPRRQGRRGHHGLAAQVRRGVGHVQGVTLS
jgi:hypothetical protein